MIKLTLLFIYPKTSYFFRLQFDPQLKLMPLDPFDMGQISFFLPYQSVDNLGGYSSTTTQKGKQKKRSLKGSNDK